MDKITAPSGKGRTRNAKLLITLVLAFMLAFGIALAYLTDNKSLANGLSLDTDLRIELTEPTWEAAKATNSNYGQNLQPMQRVDKDPTITNIGTIPLYSVARVTLPIFSGKIFDPISQTILEVTDHDLFSYSLSPGWELIDTALSQNERTYTYIYNTQLNHTESAQIFDALYVANLIEDIGINAADVIIDAFAIQAEGLMNATEAWAAYLHQETDDDESSFEPDAPLTLPEQTEGLSVSKVNARIPENITKVVFDSSNKEDNDSYYDVSIQNDRSFLAHDENGDTFVITSPQNDMIELPADSSDMFFGLSQITEIDLSGADISNVLVMDNFLAGTATETATTGSAWNPQHIRSSNNFLPTEMQAQNDAETIVDRDSAFPLASTTYTTADPRGETSTGQTHVINNTYLRIQPLPAASSKIYFTDEIMPVDAQGADDGTGDFCIDKDSDGGVVWWADTIFFDGQTIEVTKISTQQAGIKPILDRNASDLFSCQREVLNWTGVDTSKVTNMHGMFKNYYQYASWYDDTSTINLSGLDTSGASDMSDMFMGNDTVIELDLSSFNTSRVTTMYQMFSGMRQLQQLDLSNFNTTNVLTMEAMFYSCESFQSMDLTNLNTRKLTTTNNMFAFCTNLETVDVSGWTTSRLELISNTFNNCQSLKEIDLSTWDVNDNCFATGMFNSCYELETIYVNHFQPSMPSSWKMFENCYKLVGGEGTAYAETGIGTADYARIDDASNGNPGYFTYKAVNS